MKKLTLIRYNQQDRTYRVCEATAGISVASKKAKGKSQGKGKGSNGESTTHRSALLHFAASCGVC